MTTRKYDKTRLDLQYKNKNETLEFYISDTETSDFYIKLTRANMPIKLNNVIIVLCVVDPLHQFRSQLINVTSDKEGIIYCKLDKSMKSVIGDYQAKLMLVYEDEKIVTDNFTYTIKNDSFVALNREVLADDRFTILTEMLSEISKIKNREDSRIAAETERVATIERIKTEITQLTSDINSKVNANISENATKTNELISSTNATVNNSLELNTSKVDDLISKGNTSINQVETNSANLIASVETYKTDTTANIELYKITKDNEINQALTDYKTLTTQSVNSFTEEELLKIRNDLATDTTTYKATLDSKFTQLDTDLKSNVNTFISTKGNYIDNYVQSKTLELTTYMSTKNTELDNYTTTKTNELNNYVTAKTTELNNYKTTKNAEINKYISDKDTELNTSEKNRNANESRRETNEYSKGMNEANRKTAEDKRNTDFNAMKTQFSQMIKFNSEGNLEVTKIFVPK